MKNVLISGGSGMIGQKITELLELKGYQVAWLSRSPKSRKSFIWDVKKGEIDPNAIEWADSIIHLAGASVAGKRWTEERKKTILQSRTEGTQLLFDAISKAAQKPNAFISASAVGYYGFDTQATLVDESQEPGQDFLAQVVVAWENEVKRMNELHLRTVILRIGIVLDAKGGALAEMMKPPIAAPLGKGDQWMSWITKADLAKMFVFALEKTTLQGVFNAVGPNPATNQQLTQAAAQVNGKPYIGIGVPGFALRIFLGEMAGMVLGGNRVSSQKIQKAGFEYECPELKPALKEIFKN